MPYPIRRFVPGTIHHVTSRTLDEIFLLAPDPEVVEIFGACLAKTAKAHDIDVYSGLCMSDHPHLTLGDRHARLHRFMRDFLSLLARLVNKHLGRRGKFFSERYSAIPILDDEALQEVVQYSLCNPCNANLVERAIEWPGFSTLQQMLSGKSRKYGLVNWTKYHQARHRGQEVSPRDFIEFYELTTTPLPCWAHLSESEQREKLQELVAQGEQKARAIRKAKRKQVMPRRRLLKIRRTDRARNPKRGRRPLCHCSDPVTFFAYREERYTFVHEYRRSSESYRSGNFSTTFPPYAVRPPMLDIT